MLVTKKSLNENPTLTTRGKMAAEFGADIFISFHSDASGSKDRRGVHIIGSLSKPDSKSLGLKLVNEISKAIGIPVRDFDPFWTRESSTRPSYDHYTVLDWASNYVRKGGKRGTDVKNPFLIEIGYHTNPEDVKRLKDSSLDEAVAHAVADAVGLPKPKSEDELYRVQVGAFKEKDNAERLSKVLIDDGYPTYMVQGSDGLWRVQVGAFSNFDNAKGLNDKLEEDGYPTYMVGGIFDPDPAPEKNDDFVVLVTVSRLNVRSGAGTRYRIVQTVKYNDRYTITDVRGNWGKLKSGVGWIYLPHTTRI